MSRPYPLVEYARKIGKNTADFTVNDMIKFTKEWVRQEIREDLANMKQWRGEKGMAKHTTGSYQAAQMSRLAERGIESPINDGQEEIVIHTEDVVCSMELTRHDVSALKFVIKAVLTDYEMDNHVYEESLKGLLEGLEGVEGV